MSESQKPLPLWITENLHGREPRILDFDRYQRSAILLPLVQREGQLCVLFEVRAHHLRHQPGEICFPGGKINPEDKSEWDAAVRETCEELNLESPHIARVGPLDVVITPSLAMVYPFVGEIVNPECIQPHPDEVAEIFYVPLAFLRQTQPLAHPVHVRSFPTEDFPFALIPGGENYKWRTGQVMQYFYRYEGWVIWGLTARILNHFLQLLR